MADIERFSHGKDGLWQDPDGLYVDYKDFEAIRAGVDALRLRADLADELAPRLQDAQAERDRLQSELDALREGLEAEADKLRQEAERLKGELPGVIYPGTAAADNLYRSRRLFFAADRLTQLLQEKP